MVVANKAGVTTLSTPSDREVAIVRVFEAPKPLVFECWTSCKHLRHWMLGPPGWTMPICENDPRPGGTYRFVWRKADGAEMTIPGVYQEVTPPEGFVAKESWGPDWPETINTLRLTETDGRTTATLTIRYPSKDARDAALETGMKEGMDQSYDRLDEYLKSRP